MSIMINGTQKAISLSMGGSNSYNMVQAAQENAQKSQNLLYHVSLGTIVQSDHCRTHFVLITIVYYTLN